ncbi:hypothetical protein EDB83DRAFT_2429991 [Lactarius deliciosus]|nr:hypothetical protein EDB83DRAFT_2429991 [Lactarius deliciosus]
MRWSPSRSPSSLLGCGCPHRCRRRPAILLAIRYRIVLAVTIIVVVLAVAGVVVTLAVTAAVAVLSIACVVAVIAVSSVVGVWVSPQPPLSLSFQWSPCYSSRSCCVTVAATAIVLVVVGTAFHLAFAERLGGDAVPDGGRGRGQSSCVVMIEVVRGTRWSRYPMRSDSGGIRVGRGGVPLRQQDGVHNDA